MYTEENRIYSEDIIANMIHDTADIVSSSKIGNLASLYSGRVSGALSNEVEFFQWLRRNYEKSGIFNSAESIKSYMTQSVGKSLWIEKQLQGKGFEHDWMTMQRAKPQNIFKRYEAGDIPTRPGSDVTEINLFTNHSRDYQMKAYTSSANPDLTNTPIDTTVVTNAEKVSYVQNQGYDVQPFQNNSRIQENTKERIDKIKNGTVNTSYTFKNVAGTMLKAGAVGFAIGVTAETVALYSAYKNGNMSEEEYIKEILKAGANSGVVAGATAGIMVPITASITTAGVTSVVTIPIAFVLGVGIDKIVAPCFGRGKYKELLQSAKYYASLNLVFNDLVTSMDIYASQCEKFMSVMYEQDKLYEDLKEANKKIDKDLKELYNKL